LADRQSNVYTLRSLGHDLVSLNLDPTQQRDLQTAVDECVARYTAVSDVCICHRTELDRIEATVSSYWTRLDAFLSWLDATERSDIMTDVISADVDTLQRQTAQQRVCCCCCNCCCCHNHPHCHIVVVVINMSFFDNPVRRSFSGLAQPVVTHEK